MKKLSLSAFALMGSAAAAMAAPDPFNPPDSSTVVPEISALEGTAALAVLAAVVLLAWERRRRAA